MRVKTWRNLLFAACFVLFLCSVIIGKGFQMVGIDLPDELQRSQERSVLEGRTYQKVPKPSVESLASGAFQDDFEQYVADRVPQRDAVLLGNAARQRAVIALSAAVAGFDVYHTFYGSDYAYSTTYDAVFYLPYKQTDELASNLADAAEAVNSAMADSNVSGKVLFVNVSRARVSAANPAFDLVSAAVGEDYIESNLLDKLSSDISTLDLPISSSEALLEDYYHNDHHWRTSTAYEAYKVVLGELDESLEPVEATGVKVYDEVDFYGSCSRVGLCPTKAPEHVDDVLYDASELKVWVNGEEKGVDSIYHASNYDVGKWSSEVFKDRHAEFFHGDYGLITIANDQAQSGKTLLLIGDSYTNSIDRMFAESYATVYCIDPRHADGTLSEFLASHEVDDVCFMASIPTYLGKTFSEYVR